MLMRCLIQHVTNDCLRVLYLLWLIYIGLPRAIYPLHLNSYFTNTVAYILPEIANRPGNIMSSVITFQRNKNTSIYSTTKAAKVQITKAFSNESLVGVPKLTVQVWVFPIHDYEQWGLWDRSDRIIFRVVQDFLLMTVLKYPTKRYNDKLRSSKLVLGPAVSYRLPNSGIVLLSWRCL